MITAIKEWAKMILWVLKEIYYAQNYANGWSDGTGGSIFFLEKDALKGIISLWPESKFKDNTIVIVA